MVVIWAGTKQEADRWRQKFVNGRGGVVTAGDQSARTLDGLRPTAIVMVGAAGQTSAGAQVREVLNRAAGKASREVPWLDFRRVEGMG